MTKRKIQAITTKRKLYEVGLDLIRKHGYDPVTITQICKAANVSIGAFYHHFRSKASLIIEEGYALCDEYFEKEVMEILNGENAVEAIVDYIGYMMRYGENCGLDIMTQVYKAQITEANEFFLSEERTIVKMLHQLVQKAQDQGELDNSTHYKQIGREVLILARGITYNWCQSEGSYDITSLAKRMVRNYLSAYQTTKFK